MVRRPLFKEHKEWQQHQQWWLGYLYCPSLRKSDYLLREKEFFKRVPSNMPEIAYLKRVSMRNSEGLDEFLTFSLLYTDSIQTSYFSCFEELMGSFIILWVQAEKDTSLQRFHVTQSKLSTCMHQLSQNSSCVARESRQERREVENDPKEQQGISWISCLSFQLRSTLKQFHIRSCMGENHYCTDIYGLKGIQ